MDPGRSPGHRSNVGLVEVRLDSTAVSRPSLSHTIGAALNARPTPATVQPLGHRDPDRRDRSRSGACEVRRLLEAVGNPAPPGDPTAHFTRILTAGMNLASPMLVALSSAAFVIALRRPRLALRVLAREPGFVAMAVIVMTTGNYLVHFTARQVAN